jgi:outer membrane protein
MKARKKLSERVGKDDYGLKKGGRNQIFPKTLLYIKNNVYLCDSNQNLQNMTKRILLSIFAMIVLTTAAAQDVVSGFRFGYLSYEAALKAMPDYELVQQKMDQMRQQFQAETLRVEDEFNLKYEEFLDGQRDFPKTILQKRQSELQELMERNIRFKEESKKELEQTEKLLLAPLKIRLIEQLGTIARERGYAFIVDTDQKALPYINPSMGEDITLTVQDALK